jgi:predicted 3-demethylubiquinone-9 3-methyltransferase (glyoxalase superfamily)
MEKNNQTNAESGQPEVSTSSGQKITPFLWFDGNVKEALDFYTSIFKRSKIINVNQLPGPEGKIMTATFQIEGLEFMALDGGPHFSFTPAISFFVKCKTQEEVDELWENLSAGGVKERCGWLRDQFGVSWQIIPDALMKLMGDPDPVKARNVMEAMMQMDKIEIHKLQEAYDKA